MKLSLLSDHKLPLFTAVLLFLSLFLLIFGFSFSINNNVEELPLIYQLLGIADYQKDLFVSFHTTNYTQISPFLFIIVIICKILKLKNIYLLYLVCFLLTLSIYFYVLYKIQNSLNKITALIFSLILILFFLLLNSYTLVPSARWVFCNYFDLELVIFVIIFAFIYKHLKGEYKSAAILFNLASLLYPLYVIPIIPAIFGSLYLSKSSPETRKISVIFKYLLPASLYFIFLWVISKQKNSLEIDASLIMEYIRAPWHYQIPSFWFWNYSMTMFCVFCFILYLIIFFKKQKTNDFYKKLLLFNNLLILALILTSIIHTFVRVPLIIQIAPYRIGVFICMITFQLAVASLTNQSLLINLRTKLVLISNKLGLFLFLLACLPFIIIFNTTLPESNVGPAELQLTKWIRENTNQDSLFLNYTNLDLRTVVYRSDYFNFKTIPLTADQQIIWYHRFLHYQGIDERNDVQYLNDIINRRPSPNYSFTINNLQRKSKNVNKRQILDLFDSKIDYILVRASDETLRKDLRLVFSNKSYKIFLVEHTTTN